MFDITNNTTYYLDIRILQDFERLTFHGSSHGWVVGKAFKSCLFMYNPLTGLKKQLPPSSHYYTGHFGIRKCIVSSNPSLRDDYMVVAMLGLPIKSLAYTIGEYDKWNEIPCMNSLADILFYEGQLNGLTSYGHLMLIEIGSSRVFQILSPKAGDTDNTLCLVDSCVGLLMVERIRDEDGVCTTRSFNVYKFDFREGGSMEQ